MNDKEEDTAQEYVWEFARIVVLKEDGYFYMIACLDEGDPSRLGKELVAEFSTQERANWIVDRGDAVHIRAPWGSVARWDLITEGLKDPACPIFLDKEVEHGMASKFFYNAPGEPWDRCIATKHETVEETITWKDDKNTEPKDVRSWRYLWTGEKWIGVAYPGLTEEESTQKAVEAYYEEDISVLLLFNGVKDMDEKAAKMRGDCHA